MIERISTKELLNRKVSDKEIFSCVCGIVSEIGFGCMSIGTEEKVTSNEYNTNGNLTKTITANGNVMSVL